MVFRAFNFPQKVNLYRCTYSNTSELTFKYIFSNKSQLPSVTGSTWTNCNCIYPGAQGQTLALVCCPLFSPQISVSPNPTSWDSLPLYKPHPRLTANTEFNWLLSPGLGELSWGEAGGAIIMSNLQMSKPQMWPQRCSWASFLNAQVTRRPAPRALYTPVP